MKFFNIEKKKQTNIIIEILCDKTESSSTVCMWLYLAKFKNNNTLKDDFWLLGYYAKTMQYFYSFVSTQITYSYIMNAVIAIEEN